MKSLEQIIIIENRYSGKNGEPCLGEAFISLVERWKSGNKDKETALHLMFLVWYSCAEPGFLTGLPELEIKPKLFSEIFHYLGGENSNDPEVCLVVGIMAELFPWCIGKESHWVSIGKKLKKRSKSLQPKGFTPVHFTARGAYGEYFAHMVTTS